MEYASPDATRRSGAGHSRRPNEEPSRNETSHRPPKAKRVTARLAKSGTEAVAASGDGENPTCEEVQNVQHAPPSIVPLYKHKLPLSPRSTRKAKRAKPGAALASAPRESGAIVASTGKKIIF